MTSDELRKRIAKHNTLQALVGLLTLAASPLLWLFSYWVIRYMFWFSLFFLLGDKAADVSHWIGVVGLVFLAIDGLRKGWETVSLENVGRQEHIGLISPIGPYYTGNLRGNSYIISHILYIAPQVTLTGIGALRSLIRQGPFTIDLSVKIHNDLARRREWVAFDEYPGGVKAVALLKRLRLIRTEGEDVIERVRIRPGKG